MFMSMRIDLEEFSELVRVRNGYRDVSFFSLSFFVQFEFGFVSKYVCLNNMTPPFCFYLFCHRNKRCFPNTILVGF